jgi:beta-galactosidase
MKKYLLLLTLFSAFGFSDLLAAPPSYIQTDAFTPAKEKAATEWADLLVPDESTQTVATYDNQFYKGKAAVVKRSLGKGSVTYIGVDTDDSKFEKDVLRKSFTDAKASTDNYPDGIYVYWRDGFYVAVNYSSDSYTMNIPETGKILIGEKTMQPAGVLVWSE